MRVVPTVLVVGLAVGATSACSAWGSGWGPDVPRRHDHPGGSAVVLSVETGGGFVPYELVLRQAPELVVLGDGTAVAPTPGQFAGTRPAVTAYQQVDLTERDVQLMLTAAQEAGLLGGEVDFGTPAVTDMPTTTVRLTADGRTFEQSAYAVPFVDGDTALSGAQRQRRALLRAFLRSSANLVPTTAAPWTPSVVVVHRLDAQDSDSSSAPRPWPSGVPEPPAGEDSCIEVTGAAVSALLAAAGEAQETTVWLGGDGSRFVAVLRPVLPGEAGC